MSVESAERQTVIHINFQDASPTRQQSYSLKEVQQICRLSNSSYFERTKGEHGKFWEADNYGINNYNPRFHCEHVEYMVAVVNGLMTVAEAADLWALRREMIRDELTARALAPVAKPVRGKKAKR